LFVVERLDGIERIGRRRIARALNTRAFPTRPRRREEFDDLHEERSDFYCAPPI